MSCTVLVSSNSESVHGGGFVFGDINTDTQHCKRVVNGTGAVVFDVEYRCAPEYPFPIPVDDCWDALQHVVKTQSAPFNLDTSRVAVGGPSAGGHLSAVVAQRARDAGIPLVLQQLHVPVCDMDQFDEQGRVKKEEVPYESYREMYETVALSGERMEYFARHFLGVPRKPETYNVSRDIGDPNQKARTHSPRFRTLPCPLSALNRLRIWRLLW